MRLSPSLYAADPLRLGEQVEALVPHVASFHVDVMDGRFAPAFGLGERLVRTLAGHSLPVDVHLMIADPGRWARTFAKAGARRVAYQVEAASDIRTIEAIARDVRSCGALAYLAVQPTTPLSGALRAFTAGMVDGLLLLTAPAGGGPFDDAALRRVLDVPHGIPVIVDGGLEPHHFPKLHQADIELVVVGRTLFDAPEIRERALRLRRDLEGGAALV